MPSIRIGHGSAEAELDSGQVVRTEHVPGYDVATHRRGCGFRLAGGVYAAFDIAYDPERPVGREIALGQYFLERPIHVDPAALGVSPVGVTMIERNGTWHLLDWVGEQHYPTALEFANEVYAMGLSRRMPANLDFSRLDADSRILLLHRHPGRGRGQRGDAEDPRPAIFASFPISALEVVRDPVADAHTITRGRMRTGAGQGGRTQGGIPINLVER
jgi:hypothetical protein